MAMKREPPQSESLAGSLSLSQLARRWQIPQRQLRALLGQGRLTFVQVRGKLRVPREAVHNYERSPGVPRGRGVVKKPHG